MTFKKAAPVAVAIAAVGVTWLAFYRVDHSAAQDTSCHNPFRDGARSVSPKLVTDIAVGDDQWDGLTVALADFARNHRWDFKDTSRQPPGVLKALYLSLCNDSLRISVEEQRWAQNNYAHPIVGRGVAVSLYGDVPDSEWHAAAREVVSKLESEWPDKVRFRDRDGHFVERPSYLEDGRRE